MAVLNLLEHHGELSKRILRDSTAVSRFNLLLQIVLHPHTQLIQLVPLLSQAHCAMLCVPVHKEKVDN